MKNEDVYLDLENFEIEDIEEEELNIEDNKNKDIFDKALDLLDEDNKVDSNIEKDYADGIDGAEETVIEEVPAIDDKIEIISEESILNSLPIIEHKQEETNIVQPTIIKEMPNVTESVNIEPVTKMENEKTIAPDAVVEKPIIMNEDVKEDVKVIEEPIEDELDQSFINDDDEKPKKQKKEKRKEEVSKKTKIAQMTFCIISLIFILSCFGYYIPRLIKYYKIYNPKTESGEKAKLLATSITDANTVVTEGEGLYKSGSGYAFKGTKVNNYVKIGSHIFRVIKTNSDGSVDLVIDKALGSMKWNSVKSDYTKSDVNNYLNKEFIKELDKDLLTTITTCEDVVEGLDNIKCDKQNNEYYIRLLGVTEYLNSAINGSSFIGQDYNLWLYNQTSEKVWYTSGSNIIEGNYGDYNYIKPVIRLKNSSSIKSGKGTKSSPYIVGKESSAPSIGTYVKLGDDMYTVIRNESKLTYLAKVNNLTTTFRFDLNKNIFDPAAEGSVASYLNNTYLNSLSYKDLIQDGNYYTGKYINSYKDILTNKVKTKVGMLSILDSKVNISNQSFYLLNGSDNLYVNYYSAGNIFNSKITLSKNIKPVIAIDYNILKSGKGTVDSPLTTKE